MMHATAILAVALTPGPPLVRSVAASRLGASVRLAVDEAAAITSQRDALQSALERDALKLQLLRACAACNRGFGASALDRSRVDVMLSRLSSACPSTEPTSGVAGSDAATRWVGRGLENADWSDGTVADGPLEGVWRLIYTNATDVLSLDASPLAGVGDISQEFSLPDSVVNVIELYPRANSLLPPNVLRTVTRLRVGTRARARSARRVGLTFETLTLQQPALLGLDVGAMLPTWLRAPSLPLPRVPGANTAGADSDDSPAFFDVAYLDSDLLVIVQNQPGGAFALVRETEEELRMRDPRY